MTEWIHVITATKTPQKRATNSSPFETYADGFDPNGDGSTFGPSQPSQFLPVTRETEPTVDPVLNKTTKATTQSDLGQTIAGAYVSPGIYVDGDWIVDWTIDVQDLDTSKANQSLNMERDQSEALDAGYTVGQFTLPFNEEQFRLLHVRHDWMTIAINDGTIPANSQMTFSDLAGQEVSVTLTTLRNQFRQYGSDYLRIFEKAVDARQEIADAATPTEVAAVTWDFLT